jgi:uncharacterized RDD family membrane protein YckC
MTYAGFWIRFWAFLLDQFVLLILFVPAIFLLDESLFNVASIIASLLYESLFVSSGWQATPGKRLFSIRVVTTDFRRLTFGHAVGRYLAKCVSGFLLGLGYVMAAFSPRKQGLHDQWAGTLVVLSETQTASTEVATPPPTIHSPRDLGGWVLAGFDSRGHVLKFKLTMSQLLESPEGIKVGRNVGEAGIQIPDESVSRIHAVFKLNGTQLTVTDLSSTNGTFVGRTKLGTNIAATISGDQEVTFGSTTFSIGRE